MTIDNSDENPTIDNVLPEYRRRQHPKYGWEEGVFPPSALFAARGAIVALPGLAPCPWCDAICVEIEKTYLVVCVKNSKHIIQWVPWGG